MDFLLGASVALFLECNLILFVGECHLSSCQYIYIPYSQLPQSLFSLKVRDLSQESFPTVRFCSAEQEY